MAEQKFDEYYFVLGGDIISGVYNQIDDSESSMSMTYSSAKIQGMYDSLFEIEKNNIKRLDNEIS